MAKEEKLLGIAISYIIYYICHLWIVENSIYEYIYEWSMSQLYHVKSISALCNGPSGYYSWYRYNDCFQSLNNQPSCISPLSYTNSAYLTVSRIVSLYILLLYILHTLHLTHSPTQFLSHSQSHSFLLALSPNVSHYLIRDMILLIFTFLLFASSCETKLQQNHLHIGYLC